MGSGARQSCSLRFLDVFRPVMPKSEVPPHTWRSEGQVLAYVDEQVHVGILFRCVETQDTTFASEGVIYDADSTYAPDVASFFGITEEQAEAMFKEHNL